MRNTAIRLVTRRLAESLAEREAHAEVFHAFRLAMPSEAGDLLSLFDGDEKSAGYALTFFESGSAQYSNILELYLLGDPAVAQKHTSILVKTVSGALRNIEKMQSQIQSAKE